MGSADTKTKVAGVVRQLRAMAEAWRPQDLGLSVLGRPQIEIKDVPADVVEEVAAQLGTEAYLTHVCLYDLERASCMAEVGRGSVAFFELSCNVGAVGVTLAGTRAATLEDFTDPDLRISTYPPRHEPMTVEQARAEFQRRMDAAQAEVSRA